MSTVYDFHKPDDPMEQASLWLACVDRGLTGKEEQALKDWLAQSDVHVRAFMDMCELWDRMEVLSSLAEIIPPPAKTTAPKRRVFAGIGIAASIALLALGLWQGGGGLLNDGAGDLVAQQQALEAQFANKAVQTQIGEVSTIELPDGSVVTLNTDTQVVFRYSAGERRIDLERGEINVVVAHDVNRPLRAYVGNRMVQAVGTVFNLERRADDVVELLVTEGKVLVAEDGHTPDPVVSVAPDTADRKTGGPDTGAPAQAAKAPPAPMVFVAAGEELLLQKDREVRSIVQPTEIANRLSWRSGNLIFTGEPLIDVIAEVNRFVPVKVVIADDALNDIRIAGLFKTGDINGLLASLEANFDINHQYRDDKTVVLKSE